MLFSFLSLSNLFFSSGDSFAYNHQHQENQKHVKETVHTLAAPFDVFAFTRGVGLTRFFSAAIG
jgi:hypothetical protein